MFRLESAVGIEHRLPEARADPDEHHDRRDGHEQHQPDVEARGPEAGVGAGQQVEGVADELAGPERDREDGVAHGQVRARAGGSHEVGREHRAENAPS